VLALARTHGFTVVEDDLYGLLAYDQPAPPALKALDRDDAVVYLTSFSKTFMPGLRLGCLVAPPRLHERFLTLRIAADLGSPPLLQRALAAFLEDGGLRRHLRRVLPVYRERRDALLAALQPTMPPAVRWTRPAGGFCTWLTLPGRSPGGEVARLMRQAGWAVAPGEVFLAQPTGEQHLRLCFGNLAADALARGIQALGQVIRFQAARGEAIGPATGELPPLV
jgi:DNA-binding transcriptional MocR family regulator